MSDEPSDRGQIVGNKSSSRRDESTTRKNEKGTKREANLFLMNKHPELFEISPRPGGFLPHLAGRRNSALMVVDKSANQPKSSSSGTTKVSIMGRASIGQILETSIRCPSARRPVSKVDQKDNTVRMCSIAISTVMMLAQHVYDNITSEHVQHTEEYFRGLKQPDGYPHNVGQLVELLSNLKTSGKIVTSYIEEEIEELEDIYEDRHQEENSEMQMSDLIN